MKNNEDNFLDELSKKVIHSMPIESPTLNFTDAVMSEVTILNISRATVYKPLISKASWIFISIVLLAIILYVTIFGAQTEPSSWLSKIDFSVLSSKVAVLPNFKVTKTFMYAFVLFGIMLCIQIPFLKHHFNKQFEV